MCACACVCARVFGGCEPTDCVWKKRRESVCVDVTELRDVPIHRREVLPLRELLIEAPENLHDAESRRRDLVVVMMI